LVPSSAVPYLAAIGLVVTELVVQTLEMLQSSRQSRLATRQELKERLPEWSQAPVATEAGLLLVQMGPRELLPGWELLVRQGQRELLEVQPEQRQV